MARLPRLPALAALVLAGNGCAQWLPQLPPAGSLAFVVLLVPVLLRFRPTRPVAWAAIAFAWTVAAAGARLDERWSGGQRDVAVAGWIDGFPERVPGRVVFSLRVLDSAEAVPRRLRLSWYDAPPGIEPGARVAVVARLRSPRGLANPGTFDYERWLFVERIGATGYVRDGTVVDEPAATLGQRWLRMRAGLAERIMRAAPSASGGALIVALTLGERAAFTDAQWADLRRTGTSHLVAISGLHIALVAALCYGLVRIACLRTRWLASRAAGIAAPAGVVAALAYASLAGLAVPTQRAVVMVAIALGIGASRRCIGRFDAYAAAVLVVLAADPSAPLMASFWLSFGAVGVLLHLAGRERRRPRVRGRGQRLRRAVAQALRLQLGISLGLVPLSALFFGEVSLVAPLVNFAAVPVFGLLLVPLSLVAVALIALTGNDFGAVALIATLADGVWRALHLCAAGPWAAMTLPPQAISAPLVAVAAAALALPAHPLPGRRFLWAGLVPLFWAAPDRPAPGEADVLVADVGHGLAVLVTTAQHALLYDAGPMARSGFDAGSQIVVPALAARGIDRLDVLLLSHADADHAGGAPAVLAAHPEARIRAGPDVTMPAAELCAAGQRWLWDGVRFEILHPPPGFPALGNDSSCVLRVRTRGESLLIAGDIEARGERALVTQGVAGADVVVVPHHGSATSSSPAFVTAVSARVAIVSAAHDNRWGLPRPGVRRRWEQAGARVLVTANSGAIMARLGDEDGLRVREKRRAAAHYWQAPPEPSPGDRIPAAL